MEKLNKEDIIDSDNKENSLQKENKKSDNNKDLKNNCIGNYINSKTKEKINDSSESNLKNKNMNNDFSIEYNSKNDLIKKMNELKLNVLSNMNRLNNSSEMNIENQSIELSFLQTLLPLSCFKSSPTVNTYIKKKEIIEFFLNAKSIIKNNYNNELFKNNFVDSEQVINKKQIKL